MSDWKMRFKTPKQLTQDEIFFNQYSHQYQSIFGIDPMHYDEWRKMQSLYEINDNSGCSCHIDAPCSYCVNSFECEECNTVYNKEEREPIELGKDIICSHCLENNDTEAKMSYHVKESIKKHFDKMLLTIQEK